MTKTVPPWATNRKFWLTNRVLIGAVLFFTVVGFWEFHWKPQYRPYYEEGVSYYQAGKYLKATNAFQTAYAIAPNSLDVIMMLGWANLRLKRFEDARFYFDRAIRIDPRTDEAQIGAAFVALETGRGQVDPQVLRHLIGKLGGEPSVRILAANALLEVGKSMEAAQIYRELLHNRDYGQASQVALDEIFGLKGFPDDKIPTALPKISKPTQTQIRYRAADRAMWTLVSNDWQKMYVSGVNIGPGAPGYSPSSPPNDASLYVTWLQDAEKMNANVVRVYTLLPPAFYRAYKHYIFGGGKVTLYQQIRMGDPANKDLYDPKFVEATKAEIRYVVDAIHGHADVPRQRARGSGIYDQDIAAQVGALLLGRELEPSTVLKTNIINAGRSSYEGKFISVGHSTATETWLAEMLDYLVTYELETYNWEHPVAIENGPEHDPARGQVTEEKLRAMPAFAAGLFASYSVFPYFPESLTRDPQYLQARDGKGVNPVYGYLRLLRSHIGLPLVVSEFGISTSMGVRLLQMNGWNQGGYTEQSQAEALTRLAQTIRETGCAGGIIFELADEWYRQGWMREGFENPADRAMLWLNDLDPNQRYGLIGYRTKKWRLFAGDAAAWAKEEELYRDVKAMAVDAYDRQREIRSVQAGADEGYLYLRINVACLDCVNGKHDGETHLDRAAYAVAINTLPGRAGVQALPFGEASLTSGANFLLYLGDPAHSRLLVTDNYNPYELASRTDYPNEVQLIYRRGFAARLARTGAFLPYPAATGASPSLLHSGSGDPVSKDYSSAGEWYADIKHNAILVRIPWGKLLVTDPSSLRVFYGYSESEGVRAVVSTGVNLSFFALNTNGSNDLGRMTVAASAPAASGGTLQPKMFAWEPWDTVAPQPFFKKSYYAMQQEFSGRAANTDPPVKRSAVERQAGVRWREDGSQRQ